MYPRTLSTHNLCLRPFTFLESKNEVPQLLLNLSWGNFGYNVADSKVRDWARIIYDSYSNSDEIERVYVIALRKSNDIIGLISFEKYVYISILPEYQGKGYAKESLISLYDYIKNHLRLNNIFVNMPNEDEKLHYLFKKYFNAKPIDSFGESKFITYEI